MYRIFSTLLAALVAALLAGCATSRPPVDLRDIAALEAAILALDPGRVDPEEAARAARIAYTHTEELARQYQITDPPLVHNTKVNMGLKPRGLCWHWAEDMEKRLAQERFRTLALHRAIANATTWRIEHSTVIISAKGDGMYDGIVLDPWRKGGILTWVRTTDDPDYEWLPRAQVFELRARAERAKARLAGKGA